MIEKIRYTKSGKKIEKYEFSAKLNQKIIMKKEKFIKHIIEKHPEITLNIISEVLSNPDVVTKRSKSRKEHFYQKKIENIVYFIVVSSHKNIKNLRFILTAFSVEDQKFLKEKNVYFRYIKR